MKNKLQGSYTPGKLLDFLTSWKTPANLTFLENLLEL